VGKANLKYANLKENKKKNLTSQTQRKKELAAKLLKRILTAKLKSHF